MSRADGRGRLPDWLAPIVRMLDDVVMARMAAANAACVNVPPIARDPNPYWNNSAATGRECGGPQPAGGDISRQPVTGQQKDRGPSDGVSSSSRGSGRFSQVGTYRGVPIYAYESMDDDQTLYAVTSGCGGQP